MARYASATFRGRQLAPRTATNRLGAELQGRGLRALKDAARRRAWCGEDRRQEERVTLR